MQSIDEEEVKKDARYTYIETKPTYSSNVLIGHWFQARNDLKPQSRTAVVPCVLVGEKSDQECEQHMTTNREDYSTAEFIPEELSRDYIGGRVDKYQNFMMQRASIKFEDAGKYRNNYTTLNTLVYELWPKMLKEKLEKAAKNISDPDACKKQLHSWKPDRLDAYGNHSSMKRPIFKKSKCPAPTVYKRDFPQRWITPRKSAKREDMINRLA